MKRSLKYCLSLILSLVLGLSMVSGLSVKVYAESEIYNDEFEYSVLNDNTIRIDRYIGSGSIVDISETINDLTVTVIGSAAFSGNTTITDVTINEGVTTIGEGAFASCTALVDISLPSTLEIIEKDAFSGCTNLENIYYEGYGEDWAKIDIASGNDALSSANHHFSDSEITLDDDNEGSLGDDEGDETIYYEGAFEYIILPDHTIEIIEYIGSDSEVVIPSSIDSYNVSTIGEQAFYQDTTLAFLTIPETVTTIDKSAFEGCSNLVSLTLSEGLKTIGDKAFKDCIEIEAIDLPSTLTSIGAYAFYGCSALDTIELPEGLTTLGEYAFAYCTNLYDITLSPSLTTLSKGVLSHCSNLSIIDVVDNIEVIESLAFEGCTSLVDIILPVTLTTIEADAFKDCTALAEIYYEGSLDQWHEIAIASGNDYLLNGDIHYHYVNSEEAEEIEKEIHVSGDYSYTMEDDGTIRIVKYSGSASKLIIPSEIDGYTVSIIGEGAFSYCTSLKSVTIPGSVIYIDNNAFAYCTSLDELIIEEGCMVIEDYAFYNCISLKTVTLPLSIVDIEYNAFYGCDSISDVYYGGYYEDWLVINMQEGNDPLQLANIHFAINTVSDIDSVSEEYDDDETAGKAVETSDPISFVSLLFMMASLMTLLVAGKRRINE